MHEVRQIGFPILVKAARGGGGKGMKLAHKESELQARRTIDCGVTIALAAARGCPVGVLLELSSLIILPTKLLQMPSWGHGTCGRPWHVCCPHSS